MEVDQSFVEHLHLSVRKASQQFQMSKNSVFRNLKIAKFHPYKIHLHHETNEDDRSNFQSLFAFSDESTFQLNGEVNRHNCRYWNNENPHWLPESHTQYPQKLNVWADGNLDGPKYLQLLQGNIVPSLQEIAGDEYDEVSFQQDGAPAHFTRIVRDYLNIEFNNRWIDLADLRQRIINVCIDISPEIIRSAIENFYVCLGIYQDRNEEHFEHRLKIAYKNKEMSPK
ncbi:hypothetical protein TSAR_000030 [Trichomalopsis sarcophagae]|uniref:Tc1-like transposase DDE domain-containing protein n=1 Tax=Trichomalopsis sarcophagae TaxID=543379 RepID=A0A232ESW4_9HYME|nr:hypothetical protein TSAR_000030 [Trichomalopsis sarcophagae]